MPEDGISTADFLRDGGGIDGSADIDIEVLEQNWHIVQVFIACQPQFLLPTFAKRPIYMGISAVEIQAATRLCRVPKTEFEDVLSGLRVMTRVTAEIRN